MIGGREEGGVISVGDGKGGTRKEVGVMMLSLTC